jgi:hypothetical protein
MKSLSLIIAAAVIMLAVVPVRAHHSFGGTYDVSKTITIKGKMVQVTLRAPHSFLYVEVQDPDGTTRQWVIEGATAAQFAPGDRQGRVQDRRSGRSPRQSLAQPEQHARPPHSDHAHH